MDVVGLLVGTFEPARVIVAIAQANSASATTNTAPPTQPAGAAAGMNGKGMSHCKASAASTASAHAIGGRMMTLAVPAVSLMARLVNLHSWRCKRFAGYLPASLNTCGTMLRTAVLASDPVGSKQEPPVLRSPAGVFQDIRIYWDAGKPYYNPERIKNPTLLVVAERDQAAPSQVRGAAPRRTQDGLSAPPRWGRFFLAYYFEK